MASLIITAGEMKTIKKPRNQKFPVLILNTALSCSHTTTKKKKKKQKKNGS